MSLKERVLERLEENCSVSISGQKLANELGVSRCAVWKAINALKQEGYAIQATTNRGYRLSSDCDRLSADKIQMYLKETLPITVFSSLDSTNEEAKRQIMQPETPSRFVIVAEEQTNGRGRRGRTFYSPAGTGLYMTLVTTPHMSTEQMVGVTSYAAVCAAESIQAICGKQPQIKWVNDIFLDGLKIGGILTEAISDFETGRVSRLMIGIGLNLQPCSVPDELQHIMGFVNPNGQIKNQLAASILQALLRYEAEKDTYIDRCRRYSMVLGQDIAYEQNGTVYYGHAEDLDATGALIVRRDSGERDRLRSGEITLQIPSS